MTPGDGTRIVRMTCDACGATMNPHAEKPVVPLTDAEAAQADWAIGGSIEEVHHCPRCGRVQSRRV
jgi:ribosomal protein L37AE/L43A